MIGDAINLYISCSKKTSNSTLCSISHFNYFKSLAKCTNDNEIGEGLRKE